MKFLRLRIGRGTKLVLWSALFFFFLFSLMILGYYHILQHVIRSNDQVRAFIVEYFHQRGIKVTFDDIKTNLFWRPSIVLNNVHLSQETSSVDYDLRAKRISISLSSKIVFNQIEIYRLSIFDSSLYINFKENQSEAGKSDLIAIPHFKKISLPKYIISEKGSVIIENKGKYYSAVLREVDLKLSTPKHYLSYLEVKGNILSNGVLNEPILFSLQGILNLNKEGSITAENLALSLDTYATTTKQYKTDVKFDLNWDIEQNQLSINHVNFTGTDAATHLNYKGNISQISWVDYQQIIVPKVSITANQKNNNVKTDGYLVFNHSSCRKSSCLVDDVSFGLTYGPKDKSFVLRGNAMMDFNLDERSVNLKHLVFNSKKTNETGSMALWILSLKGSLFYRWEDYLLLELDGLLDKKDIHIVVQNASEGKLDKKLWSIVVSLNSFDLEPYFQKKQEDSLLKIYNDILAKIPKIFTWLKDEQLRMSFDIDRLNFPNFFLVDISGKLSYDLNHIQLSNLKGKVSEGDFLTNLDIQLDDKTIKYKIEQSLRDLDLGSILFYFTNFSLLSGNGRSYISLQTEGNNVADILAHMNGFSSLEIHQGVIWGYNLENIVSTQGRSPPLHTESLTNKQQNSSKEVLKKNPFGLFKLVNYWTNGIGETVALQIDSPQFQLKGEGTTDLVKKSIDYSLLLSGYVSKNRKKINITVPIKLVGSLFAPQYYLDSKKVLELLDDSDNKEQTLKDFIRQQWELIR